MNALKRLAVGAVLGGALAASALGVGSAAANAAPSHADASWATEKPWYPSPDPRGPRGGGYWGPPPPPVKHDIWDKRWAGPGKWDQGWKPHCDTGPHGFVQYCK